MEYINKQSDEGLDLISDYLTRCKEFGYNYPIDFYGNFDRKSELREILIDEQGERCCYCMRKLEKSSKTTLEHLIINNIKTKVDFDNYLTKQTILNDNVCYASDFIRDQIIKYPPYPHTIAYHNLVASCNGKLVGNIVECCNNKRGDKFIEPIVLFPNIREKIIYKKNGFAKFPEDISGDDLATMGILGLNSNMLRWIRILLIYIKENGLDLNGKREKIVIGALEYVSEDDYESFFNFKNNDEYWNLLKEYDYFLINPNIE